MKAPPDVVVALLVALFRFFGLRRLVVLAIILVILAVAWFRNRRR